MTKNKGTEKDVEVRTVEELNAQVVGVAEDVTSEPTEHVESIEEDTVTKGIKTSEEAELIEPSKSIEVSTLNDEVNPDVIEDSEAEFLLAPYEQKKTIKRLKGFLIGVGLLGLTLTTIVVVLFMQLDEREGIIKTTQGNLLATEEALNEEQKDAGKVSKLVIEQQEKIKQYEADIEQYKLVVEERDKEIAKLETIQAETNTKVLGLETQVKEMSETFEKFKSDILGIVEE